MPSQKIVTSTSAGKATAKKRKATPSTKQKASTPPISPSMATRPAEILALQRTYGNQTVLRLLANRLPQAGGVIQRLKYNKKEITREMVEAANLAQLEIWSKIVPDEWDDEVYARVKERLTELRSTPRELFKESLKGHAQKGAIMGIYEVNPGLATAVRDQFKGSSNPRLPEALLKQLRDAGLLWLSWKVYRMSSIANGVVYYFWLSKTGGTHVGEWHVHWEARKKPGNPGWKSGLHGEKTGGENIEIMKNLIGKKLWGKTGGFSGARQLAGID